MPKITNDNVLKVLANDYFQHHVAMHLARERAKVTGGKARMLLLPPSACKDCQNMIPAGDPGSGKQFLEMHHEMIRVFRYLLNSKNLKLGAQWKEDHWQGQPGPDYSPALWDLDDWNKLPQEIRAMFSLKDPHYLEDVFGGAKTRTKANGKGGGDPIDDLGQFLEHGVKPGKPVNGEGFHNTLHEYLGSREGKAAAGAEMNNLVNARYNDYFWSLHLWIDAQYGRLLKKINEPFDVSPLDPDKAMFTKKDDHAMQPANAMVAKRGPRSPAKAAHQP